MSLLRDVDVLRKDKESKYSVKTVLSKDGLEEVAEELKKVEQLRELTFEEGTLSVGAISVIGTIISRQGCLQVLHLSGNKLGDAGTALVATALETNIVLQRLFLECNAITSVGALALSESLKRNATLQELYLGTNKIKNEAAIKLVQTPSGLTYLNLFQNFITDSGVRDIIEALHMNPLLRTLILDANLISSETLMRKVASVLEKNRLKTTEAASIALTHSESAPFRRTKLMVVGEGRAGKTATVRALLHEKFQPRWVSTIGVSSTEVETFHDNWKKYSVRQYAVDLATKIVAHRLRLTRAQRENNPNASWKATSDRRSRRNLKDHWRSSVNRRSRKNVQNTSAREVDYDSGSDFFDREALPRAVKKKTRNKNKNKTKNRYKRALEVQPWLLIKANNAESVHMNVWDYGGQRVFYTLHHIFLTKYGVYLVVFDMVNFVKRQPTSAEVSYIRFWIDSIRLHAAEAPVLIVGSFLDRLDKPERRLQEIEDGLTRLVANSKSIVRNEKQSLSFWPVSNKQDVGVSALRLAVEGVAKKQDFINRPVYVRWTRTLDDMLKENSSEWLDLSVVANIGRQYEITSKEELHNMLQLFHELGMIFYFTQTDNLSNIVILNPQWLVDCISMVIRDHKVHQYKDKKNLKKIGLYDDVQRLFSYGLATKDLLEYLWGRDKLYYLIDLMQSLLLMSNWSFKDNEEQFFVPSMVKAEPLSLIEHPEKHYNFCFVFSFLPVGVFERLLCLCVGYSSSVEGVREPKFRYEQGEIYFNKTEKPVIFQKRGASSIVVSAPHAYRSKDAEVVVNLLQAMLKKIKVEVMGSDFNWTMHMVLQGLKVVAWEEVVARKLMPWMRKGEIEDCKDSAKDKDLLNERQMDDFMEDTQS